MEKIANEIAALKEKYEKEPVSKEAKEVSREYEQFMTFWNAVPLFDVSELNPEGRERFLHCKQLAEQFYPIVKEKGFYAWDINERMGCAETRLPAELFLRKNSGKSRIYGCGWRRFFIILMGNMRLAVCAEHYMRWEDANRMSEDFLISTGI